MIKDDLHSQIKRQQLEHQYEIDKLSQDILDRDRKIQEQRIQIDN